MSDLAAAAAALGVPEAIVQRSAAARAAETGMTVDEVLSAWAGGGSAPVPTTAPAPAEEPAAAEPVEEPVKEPALEPAVTAPPAASSPAAPTAGAPAVATPVSGRPPILVGKTDKPLAVLVGAVGLFVAVFLVGLVGPALTLDEPGARSSDLPYTELAQRGHDLYLSVGCASCHTQMVRPIVADVGLGAVTLSNSNQALGTRRFGPDLSDAGTRLGASRNEAIIAGLGGHPALSLSSNDIQALVTYLVESKTSVAATEPATPEEGADE